MKCRELVVGLRIDVGASLKQGFDLSDVAIGDGVM